MAASWLPSTPNAAPVSASHTYEPAEKGFARVENLGEERARLFVKTGRAYHRAFAKTRSASLERTLRYPDYLMEENLPGLLRSALRNASSSTCWCL
jgi:hypothetical protein